MSRDEHDEDGPITVRRVLRRFVRHSLVLEVAVGGRVIGTTAEHPFWVRGKGWTDAQELQVGDDLRLQAPGWAKVEAVRSTGRYATVYNLEVEGDHTYFVGGGEWGFSVWAHNSNLCGKELSDTVIKGWSKGSGGQHFTKHGVELGFRSFKEYTDGAKAFAKENGPLMLVVKVNNHFFKYDQATQRILILNGDRTLKTFYRANDGIRSFFDALQKNDAVVRKNVGKKVVDWVFGYGPF